MSQTQNEPRPPFPAQKQNSPGIESKLKPAPRYQAANYKPANKLEHKKAFVTGGDSGIGRAVALLFAREGADVAITFLPQEQSDAEKTAAEIEKVGRKCFLISGDLTDESFCEEAIEKAVNELGGLNILVSNAAHQMRKSSLEELTSEEWHRSFKTNVYAYFHLVKAALKHLHSGDSIIVTSSETAYITTKELPDYSATKGAINSFTWSLAKMLIERGIRVNAVAPGACLDAAQSFR